MCPQKHRYYFTQQDDGDGGGGVGWWGWAEENPEYVNTIIIIIIMIQSPLTSGKSRDSNLDLSREAQIYSLTHRGRRTCIEFVRAARWLTGCLNVENLRLEECHWFKKEEITLCLTRERTLAWDSRIKFCTAAVAIDDIDQNRAYYDDTVHRPSVGTMEMCSLSLSPHRSFLLYSCFFPTWQNCDIRGKRLINCMPASCWQIHWEFRGTQDSPLGGVLLFVL